MGLVLDLKVGQGGELPAKQPRPFLHGRHLFIPIAFLVALHMATLWALGGAASLPIRLAGHPLGLGTNGREGHKEGG